MLRHHDAVHVKLDSEWGADWKPSPEEWPAIEAYMGVFERIQVLIDERVLTLRTVDRLYSYRVLNIVSNDHIRAEKLVEKEQFWPDFCKLWHGLERCPLWNENVQYRASH